MASIPIPKNSPTVFVTGSDGLLGTNTIHTLLSEGYRVIALVHPESRSRTLDNLDVEIVKGDILDPPSFLYALHKADYIIHIAAITDQYPARNPMMRKVNIEGSRNLLKAAQEANIKRFIYISSANICSPGTASNPGTEKNNYDGWKFGSDYMDSKYLATQLFLKAYNETGFPVVILAPTFMIGPYDSIPSSGRLLLNYYYEKLPAYSKGVKNFVAVKDVAQAAVNALTRGRVGECYLAANKNMTYHDFFKEVAQVTNKPFKMFYLPFPLLIVFATIMAGYSQLFGKPVGLTYKIARLSGMEQYYTAKKAIRELGMPQSDISTAIKECITWMVENNIKI